jgi:putative ABC transport system substrate-binding protein
MQRRDFIKVVAGSAAVWPLAARAQQSIQMKHLGVLMNETADNPEAQNRFAAFLQGLQEAGWAVGRNLRIDIRWGAGDVDRLRRYAAELVSLAPDVILGQGFNHEAFATGDPHRADCVPGFQRSSRRRVR